MEGLTDQRARAAEDDGGYLSHADPRRDVFGRAPGDSTASRSSGATRFARRSTKNCFKKLAREKRRGGGGRRAMR